MFAGAWADRLRAVFSIHGFTFLFFVLGNYYYYCIYICVCTVYTNCKPRCSSKWRHAYVHIHIWECSFIAHHSVVAKTICQAKWLFVNRDQIFWRTKSQIEENQQRRYNNMKRFWFDLIRFFYERTIFANRNNSVKIRVETVGLLYFSMRLIEKHHGWVCNWRSTIQKQWKELKSRSYNQVLHKMQKIAIPKHLSSYLVDFLLRFDSHFRV